VSQLARAAVVLLAVCLGCSSLDDTIDTDVHQFGAKQREKLLQDAGFHIAAADTPQKINALNGLPPGRISRVGRGGQIYFVYPDRFECHCLWVGNGEQYARYQRLVADEMPGMALEGPGAEVDAFGNGPDPWGDDPW
jgi:hypothetical protein